MQSLVDIVAQIEGADAPKDAELLKQLRQQVLTEYPSSPEATEAGYKLGLDALFREHDNEKAVTFFKNASAGSDRFWSAAARTSLALCFYRQGKTQKALHELRRVAHSGRVGSHEATALSFLESIFVEQGILDEAKRTRRERIKMLETLSKKSLAKSSAQAGEPVGKTSGKEAGYYFYQLGVALVDEGEHIKAREAWKKAKGLGPEIVGAELFRQIVEALA